MRPELQLHELRAHRIELDQSRVTALRFLVASVEGCEHFDFLFIGTLQVFLLLVADLHARAQREVPATVVLQIDEADQHEIVLQELA